MHTCEWNVDLRASLFLSEFYFVQQIDSAWQTIAERSVSEPSSINHTYSALDPPVCAINTSSSTSAAGAPGFGVLCHIFSVCTFEMSKWFNSEKIRIGWVLLHRLNKKFVLLSVDREKEDTNNSKVKNIWIQMLNMTIEAIEKHMYIFGKEDSAI